MSADGSPWSPVEPAGSVRRARAALPRTAGPSGWTAAPTGRPRPALCAGIRETGGEAVAVPADLTDPAQIESAFAGLEEQYGAVLGLVNNAGVRADALSPQISDEQWDLVLETNLSMAFRCARRALPPMLRRRFGRIVNVASIVGPRANPGQANYAASKAGLIGMSKTIAVEVARRGITVNAVAPGFVETKLTEGIGEEMRRRSRRGVPASPRRSPPACASSPPGSVLCDRHDADRRRRPQRLISQCPNKPSKQRRRSDP